MKVTTRKYMGDDRYSWAVFVNGVVRYTGCSQSEATFRKRQILRDHARRQHEHHEAVQAIVKRGAA
jgi:hypothetical protein